MINNMDNKGYIGKKNCGRNAWKTVISSKMCKVFPEMTKSRNLSCRKRRKSRYLLCQKCRKSRYFCGRILARFLRSRKVFEVFHVCLLNSKIWNSAHVYYPKHVSTILSSNTTWWHCFQWAETEKGPRFWPF